MAAGFREKVRVKLVDPILAFLKQGMTPNKLALSISLGFCFGLFPIVGITTLLCLAISLILKLNVAAMQLINYLVYPVQLIIIIPLIHLGSYITGVNPIPYSIQEIIDIVNKDMYQAFELLGVATLMGILAWVIIIVPLSVIIYIILRMVFFKLART